MDSVTVIFREVELAVAAGGVRCHPCVRCAIRTCNTIRARIASACDDVASRVHRSRVCRSPSGNTNDP
jgi:hypothetical protein